MIMLSFWLDDSILSSRGLRELVGGRLGGLGFMEQKTWRLCVMWTLMVSSDYAKHLDVLA